VKEAVFRQPSNLDSAHIAQNSGFSVDISDLWDESMLYDLAETGGANEDNL
jgi:uncharacterized protein YihD (DUF1040 family)